MIKGNYKILFQENLTIAVLKKRGYNTDMIRSLNPATFLREEEKKRVKEAIDKTEKETSGEIKLYVARFCWEKIEEKAYRVFNKLGLFNTKDRNGVLIYVVTKNREFFIYGDEGIHKKVPENFWEEIKNRMAENFRKGDFGKGLVEAIEKIGENLKTYFPYRSDDKNEIPDEIEYGQE